jgi:MFS family permease
MAEKLDLEPVPSAKSLASTFSPIQEVLFITLVCMGQFMTQTNIGIVLSPLDIVADSFGITEPGISSWFLAGYSLTVGTFILVSGRCGDLFGYRRMFIIGFCWLALWSLVAGVSVYSNHILFIFARVLQGIGGALLLPNGLALLGATYAPGKRKNMIFAIFGATAPNSALLGTVFGAIFGQLAWWPWIYWSQTLICIGCAVLASIVIPSIHHDTSFDSSSLIGLIKALDALGGACGIGGLVLVNIAWNQAPIVGWSQPYVYVLLIIGIILILSFFYVEFCVSEYPLIPFHALSRDVSFVLGCVACGWGSFGIWIFYFWQFQENLRHTTPLLASAEFVPVGPIGIIACVVTGYLMSHLRPGTIMMLSMTAFTLGNVLVAIAPVHQTYWALTFVCLLVIPWGMDMSFPAATLMLSNAVERKHQGIAASLVTTVVNYSISLSLGFAGTVEVHVNNGGTTPGDVLKGYRGALYVAIGLGGLGMVLSAIYAFKGHRAESRSKNVESEESVESGE